MTLVYVQGTIPYLVCQLCATCTVNSGSGALDPLGTRFRSTLYICSLLECSVVLYYIGIPADIHVILMTQLLAELLMNVFDLLSFLI